MRQPACRPEARPATARRLSMIKATAIVGTFALAAERS
jgi:hypothetical protein